MAELSIAIVSDVVCPWCYLGKRRLEWALDHLDLRSRTSLTWLPFELNPEMPDDEMDRGTYRIAKFGAEKSAQLDQQMTALGQTEGIAFSFDRQKRTPNTRRAHMLIMYADQVGVVDMAVERLFRAYFEDGLDIGSVAILAEIAEQAGLDRNAALAAIHDKTLFDEIQTHEAQAARMGISGVPFFIINKTWAVSGAQPAERWIEALQAMMKQPPATMQDDSPAQQEMT